MQSKKLKAAKPWSIATAIRNPDRVKLILSVLQELEGKTWNEERQIEYQVKLIQQRLYGYGRAQFYQGLSKEQVSTIADIDKAISYKKAKEIFDSKQYVDPAMRGRQSYNPLKKLGLASNDNNILSITESGRMLLADDDNLAEVFFRSFVKWQEPNLGNKSYADEVVHNIKPFIGTLHLINRVNQKEAALGNKPKGLSKQEFSLFTPTLVHYKDIDAYAEKIISLRRQLKKQSNSAEFMRQYAHKMVGDFLSTEDEHKIKVTIRNLSDYGDNAIRCFRITKYIIIRGGGFYVDLEPRRSVEINSLLENDNAAALSFASKAEYHHYLRDPTKPELPWETAESYSQIIEHTLADINDYEKILGLKTTQPKPLEGMSKNALTNYAEELRQFRQGLQHQKEAIESQKPAEIRKCIEKLRNIKSYDKRPLLLEQLSAFGLQALNDAIKIKPNHPLGDDNQPSCTAPANTPDIECFYSSFNAICEVTMLRDRLQWINEGQPVMRHLRDFEEKHQDKACYCLFIAPSIHRDTLNTFWAAIRFEYEGIKQKIIPITIAQFIDILEILLAAKDHNAAFTHSHIIDLYNEILTSANSCGNSAKWVKGFDKIISKWGKELIT